MKPLKSSAKPIIKKLGTVQTIDMNTGEVVAEQKNAMIIIPTKPGVCQECATDHDHDMPHNKQSLTYQYRFYADHGRWPTWTDAMQHCRPEVKEMWRKCIIEIMKKNCLEIPLDLLEVSPEKGR